MAPARAASLRLGLIGPLPPPSGGMANQTLQLERLLRGEGIQVETVQVNPPYRPAWVTDVRGLRAAFRLLPYTRRLWRAAGRVQLFHVMANSGWSWHLFAAPAVWVAKMRRVPVVVNYRGGEAETFFHRSFRWIRPTLRRADAVIVPSAFLHRVFARWNIESLVVPNIIDLTLFKAQERPSRGPSGVPPPHIIVTRNLERIYDIPTALRAFQVICRSWPDARFTVAGSGPEEQALKALASRLGIASAVTFTGRIDNARMADLYGSADLMVNPSLADNMPVSILEALATGVPIVSTNVGGVSDLVEDDVTARLVPAGDHQAMAEAISDLLTDTEAARRMAMAGRELVQKYEWSAVRDRLFEVYGNAAGPGREVAGQTHE